MKRVGLALVIVVGIAAIGSFFAWRHLSSSANTPYAGQQTREIKSLSANDIEQLRAGKGWGFAKSAELNGYPGPSHVLELAAKIGLAANQRAQIQGIFDRMQGIAQRLGARFLDAERALDAAFVSGKATPDHIAHLTKQVGLIRAKLRATHLNAHLETKPVLSPKQVALYTKHRGYGKGHDHGGH